MKKNIILSIVSVLLLNLPLSHLKAQKQNDERKAALTEWQGSKFGMFIHWGLYSVPAGVWNGEKIPFYAEQIMNHARIDTAEYAALATKFNPQSWNADEIVRLAKDAGMKYIVFTAKHHDGFCMFKTKTTGYNVVDATPFGRDPIQELASACAKYGLKLGLYYSLPDWHFGGGIPRNAVDKSTNCTQHVNQLYSPLEQITPALEDYIVAQLEELLTQYGDLVTLWFDMGLATPEQSCRFRETVTRHQPKCLINGRIMNNQGDYFTLTDNSGMVGYSDIAWDNPASLYGTWGYRSWENRGDYQEKALRQIDRLVNTVSHGGVFLLNIGPTGNGEVIDFEKNVLHKIGEWTAANQSALYHASASPFPQLDKIYCTQKQNKLFFFVHQGDTAVFCRNLLSPITKAYFLNHKELPVSVARIDQGFALQFVAPQQAGLHVIVVELSETPEVIPYYIMPHQDTFGLSPDDALTHAAFDGTGYVSLQNDSWKEWFIHVADDGQYQVWIEYVPQFIAKKYSLSIDNQTIMTILPGVDDMLQTAFIGTFDLKKGNTSVQLKSAAPCDVLEPLGLMIQKLKIVKISKP